MKVDQQLKETEYIKRESWGKILNHLKRQFDCWAIEQLGIRGHPEFKMAYMPFLMNITPEGINNKELAQRAKVTKQAMSKVSNELEHLGYIKLIKDRKDKRSVIFQLTTKGKAFVVDARLCVKDLMDEYRRIIGRERFDNLIEALLEISAYNEQKYLDAHE